MSLYEALDNFVGAGVLVCAGMVGAEMPAAQPLDGAALSRHLRAHRAGDGFGAALDGLAHAIWMVQEQRGFSLGVSEAHAAMLADMLGVIRFEKQELISALAGGLGSQSCDGPGTGSVAGAGLRLAHIWMDKARATGAFDRPGFIEDVAQFLLTRMLTEIVEQPLLLEELRGALIEFRRSVDRGDAKLGQLAAPMQPEVDALNAAVEQLRGARDVRADPIADAIAQMPRGARERFRALLEAQPLSEIQRRQRLVELGNWLVATTSHLRRASNEGADVAHIKARAADHLDAGQFELAMDLLKGVRDRLREQRRAVEARIAEELETLRVTMLEEAAAAARLGELAMARFDFAGAADFFGEAAAQLPAKESAFEFDYRQRQAEALAAHAETTGDDHVIRRAVEAFRASRRLLVRERDRASWVRASVGLADMLLGLARAERGDAARECAEAAVVAFAEAAETIDRGTKPKQWALVQLSHACALIDLGSCADRERYWKGAAALLVAVLETAETCGAAEIAEAAREKLRQVAGDASLSQRELPLLRSAG